MEIQAFTARDLFDWLTTRETFMLLDVRNNEEFERYKVEGPYPFEMINVPYMEFIDHESESMARVPGGKKLRIVCAKEGSAKYVGEILLDHGYADVAYMQEGIKAWGNMLVPVRVGGNDGYELFQFQRPGKASCSYGLLSDGEMMVFDPAKDVAAYQTFADANACRITRTFETHRQADYISGSQTLHQAAGVEIIAPEPDFKGARFSYSPVSDGDIYTFSKNGPPVRAIHTPGHTPGSTSYLVDETYLISGDTVFILSIGRPDLGGMSEAWSEMLFNTMTEKILAMDELIQILPGHYMDWKEANRDLIFMASLKEIKEKNVGIYGIKEKNEFYEFIRSNMRPQPKEYVRIREINAGSLEVDDVQRDVMDLGKNECAASAGP